MREPHIYFDEVNQRQGGFHRRTFLIGACIALGETVLIARLAQLQLADSNHYQVLASHNRFRYRLVPPSRGRILDRDGVELASNRSEFRLLIRRDEVENPKAMIDSVAKIIPITEAKRNQILHELSITPRHIPVEVASDLSWDEFCRINIRLPELPGLTADVGESRVYPLTGAFAHVIGYVSKVSASDLEQAKKTNSNAQTDTLLQHPSFRIGKIGVEKSMDLVLRGKPGGQKVEVDSIGRVIREMTLGDLPSTAGGNVVLSLDADVQKRALDVFEEEAGAAVLMDVRNGDVLCLLSTPSFDPNRFVSGVPETEYRALHDYDHQPLLNKALGGLYPPGSTFKPMTALAALEFGHVDPQQTIHCSGQFFYGGRYFHCWKPHGHGSVNMTEAIKSSCDIYFYQMALRLDPDQLAATASAFGLGQVFDIGISGQQKGTVPSRAWKKAVNKHNLANQPWFAGENLSYGIGQGALQVNALQLAVMTSRLANGQKQIIPRLIKSIDGVQQKDHLDFKDIPLNKDHINFVRAGMQAVANDVGGTAYHQSQLNLGDIKMAGKTGSAQVHGYGNTGSGDKARDTTHLSWKLRDHGLFVAFAPYDDPRYAIAVIVEHGLHGATAAAPRAAEIMKVALLKDPDIQRRIQRPLPEMSRPDLKSQPQTPMISALGKKP